MIINRFVCVCECVYTPCFAKGKKRKDMICSIHKLSVHLLVSVHVAPQVLTRPVKQIHILWAFFASGHILPQLSRTCGGAKAQILAAKIGTTVGKKELHQRPKA